MIVALWALTCLLGPTYALSPLCVLGSMGPPRVVGPPAPKALAVSAKLSPQSTAQAGTAEAGGRKILVVPFETPGRDGRTYWLGEAIAVLTADDMRARGIAAIPREARERAYEQLHLPPHSVLSRATVI